MKTYETAPKFFNVESTGSSKIVAAEDPKRPGMYKTTEVVVTVDPSSNFNNLKVGHKWSHLYGKCNQSKILDLIKNMTEVEA